MEKNLGKRQKTSRKFWKKQTKSVNKKVADEKKASAKQEKTESATAEKKSVVKKRGVDKWKKKIWFTLIASKEFDRKELGTTVAEKPQLVMGRTVAVGVRQLSGDPKKSHVTLIFKAVDVKGNKAYCDAIGHEIKDSYLRKFTRRRNSKVELVKFIESSDNKKIKIKTIVLTNKKSTGKKKTALRKVIADKLDQISKKHPSQEIISELVFGSLVQKIFSDAKKVEPLKRVEITKSRIIG